MILLFLLAMFESLKLVGSMIGHGYSALTLAFWRFFGRHWDAITYDGRSGSQNNSEGNTSISSNKYVCPKGLPNVGNTCFSNVIIQSLYWTPNFRRLLQNICNSGKKASSFLQLLTTYPCGNMCQLTSALLQVMNQLNDNTTTLQDQRRTLQNLLNIIRDIDSQYKEFHQQDSYELFNMILNRVDKEIEKISASKRSPRDKGAVPVQQLFSGYFMTTYHYSGCSHVGVYFQKFTSLNVQVTEISPVVLTETMQCTKTASTIDLEQPTNNEKKCIETEMQIIATETSTDNLNPDCSQDTNDLSQFKNVKSKETFQQEQCAHDNHYPEKQTNDSANNAAQNSIRVEENIIGDKHFTISPYSELDVNSQKNTTAEKNDIESETKTSESTPSVLNSNIETKVKSELDFNNENDEAAKPGGCEDVTFSIPTLNVDNETEAKETKYMNKVESMHPTCPEMELNTENTINEENDISEHYKTSSEFHLNDKSENTVEERELNYNHSEHKVDSDNLINQVETINQSVAVSSILVNTERRVDHENDTIGHDRINQTSAELQYKDEIRNRHEESKENCNDTDNIQNKQKTADQYIPVLHRDEDKDIRAEDENALEKLERTPSFSTESQINDETRKGVEGEDVFKKQDEIVKSALHFYVEDEIKNTVKYSAVDDSQHAMNQSLTESSINGNDDVNSHPYCNDVLIESNMENGNGSNSNKDDKYFGNQNVKTATTQPLASNVYKDDKNLQIVHDQKDDNCFSNGKQTIDTQCEMQFNQNIIEESHDQFNSEQNGIRTASNENITDIVDDVKIAKLAKSCLIEDEIVKSTNKTQENIYSSNKNPNCFLEQFVTYNSADRKYTDVEEGLRSLMKTDNDDSHTFVCDKCPDKETRCPKTTMGILIPPPILILHINKVERTTDGHLEKLRTDVTYPEYIDLDKLDIVSTETFEMWKNKRPNMTYSTHYRLYSVVCHRGTMNAGHYFAYIRNTTDNDKLLELAKENLFTEEDMNKIKNRMHSGICNKEFMAIQIDEQERVVGDWFKFSDFHVRQANSDEALNSDSACMLFYEMILID